MFGSKFRVMPLRAVVSIPEFAFSDGRGFRLGPSTVMNLTTVLPNCPITARGIYPNRLALRPIGRECSGGSQFPSSATPYSSYRKRRRRLTADGLGLTARELDCLP